MNAIQAMICCLCYVHGASVDGEFISQIAYDVNGDPHWFAWNESQNDVHGASPRMCSESPTPFAEALSPYSAKR